MIQTHHGYKQTKRGPKFTYFFLLKNYSSNHIANRQMIIKLYMHFLLKTIYTKLEQIRERGAL